MDELTAAKSAPPAAAEQWPAIKDRIKESVGEQTFQTWFGHVEFEAFENNILLLSVPDEFYADWLKEHYEDLIRSASELLGVKPEIRFMIKQSQHVIDRLRFINPGENAFTAILPEKLRLNVKGAKISQIYKRLDPGKPAYTVTGSGGGGTHIYHWKENRALTNRERARLQTFPDNYFFSGSKESVRKQIGMAVPPFGVKIIFEAVLKCFASIEYPKIENNIKNNVYDNRIDTYQMILLEEQKRYAVC
jgi:site-specific DNA-cytosine methylase